MSLNYTKFTVTGDYVYSSQNNETFEGTLVHLSNEIIIGSIIDHEAPEKSKLVLGIMNDQSLDFWKFQPLSTGMAPIVYSLKSENNSSEIFNGKWIAFNNEEEYTNILVKIPEICELFSSKNVTDLYSIMNKIEKESITNILQHGLIDAISEYGHPASLTLKKE